MPLTESVNLVLKNGFTWNETVWNPSMISTALWLDAADASTVTTVSGAVSQWNDKSGNGRNATQSTSGNRPTYTSSGLNSRNVITFNSASSHWIGLSSSVFSSQLSFSWFAVADRTSTTGVASLFCERVSGDNDSMVALVDTRTALLNRPGGTGANALIEQTETVVYPTNSPQILGSVQAPTSGSAFRNGTQTASNTATKANLTFRALAIGGGQTIDALSAPGQQFWPGYICEFIVTRNTVSTDVRQRIEGYLAHKWGLTANLPGDHPYKTVGPTP